LFAGTSSLPDERRALFAGFVLGDGRDETPEVIDDFRASGLSHLLVVSGENVAFVLGLVAPLLRRLGLRGRLIVGLAVLGLFGVLTRWEPSVLRAEAMAALALVASMMGRPASGLRLLALAVTGLLLVDPLLVTSLGFALSVGASAGIAVLARPITAAIPGPRPVASALGVSVAAQAGVSPLLVPAFGSVPLATFPANLLAIPAAGPLVAWGMAAGIPAGIGANLPDGLGGGVLARIIHLPTGVLLAWVATVARYGAAAPLGRLRMTHLVVLAAAALAAVLLTRHRARWMALAGVAVCVAAAVPALAPGPLEGRQVSPGARVWRRGGATVLVVDGARSPTALLAGMHEADVSRIDVVVVSGAGRGTAGVVGPLLRRYPPRLLLAPSGSPLPGASVPEPGTAFAVGPLTVTVDAVAPDLAVTVEAAGGTGGPAAARAPPR
ncbi:MAG: ComEC/Rec2 family competence protein, partial [Acidimicrobiales bacterium]